MDVVLQGDIDWMNYNMKNTVILSPPTPLTVSLGIKYINLFPDLLYAQRMGSSAYVETISYFHKLLSDPNNAKISKLTKSTMLIVLEWWPDFGDFYREMIRNTPKLDTPGFRNAVDKMERYLELGYRLIKEAETY